MTEFDTPAAIGEIAEQHIPFNRILGVENCRIDASASLLRTGSRVAVTRMEFHNDHGTLIAVGTGTYIVG